MARMQLLFKSEFFKTVLTVITTVAVCVSSLLSLGATWKDLPLKVELQDKKIEALKVHVDTVLEKLRTERTEDREILIRIDERIKRLDSRLK